MLFVEDGMKVNSKVHTKMLAENLLLRVTTETWGTHYIVTQDGAQVHAAVWGSVKTQDLCKDHFCVFWVKELWPSSSLDINLLDLSVWSILESEV